MTQIIQFRDKRMRKMAKNCGLPTLGLATANVFIDIGTRSTNTHLVLYDDDGAFCNRPFKDFQSFFFHSKAPR